MYMYMGTTCVHMTIHVYNIHVHVCYMYMYMYVLAADSHDRAISRVDNVEIDRISLRQLPRFFTGYISRLDDRGDGVGETT